MLSLPAKIQASSMPAKNFSKIAIKTIFVDHDFAWQLEFVSQIFWLIVSENNFLLGTLHQTLLLPPRHTHTPSNLRVFANFGKYKAFLTVLMENSIN